MLYWLILKSSTLFWVSICTVVEKNRAAQLSSPFTEHRLRQKINGKPYFAGDKLFPFEASLSDRSLGYVLKSNLTRMRAFQKESVSELGIDYYGIA